MVICDVDGVLADFTWGFTSILEKRPRGCGTQLTWEFQATGPEISRAWAEVDGSKTFWQELRPLMSESDVDDFRYLTRNVHPVYMTSRKDAGNDTQGQTERWLRMMGMPQGVVILESDKATAVKQGVEGTNGEFVEVVGFLDDSPTTVNKMCDVLRAGKVHIRDWSYNRDAVTHRAVRVSSLGEFAQRVGASL